MSADARASILGVGAAEARRRRSAEPVARPRVRVITFAALALYGVIRWGTLFDPAPTWRLLGLLGLALALVVLGPPLARRHWALGVASVLVAFLAMFPICGVPLSWMRHARVELIANGIGQGLSSLPAVLLPYNGINVWTHVVILLGAGVLLLDAAIVLAFTGAASSDVRRAGAALPVVALAVVPSTLIHPDFPYLQGLLLFGLLAAFMWGERIPRADRGAVIGLCALAGLGALIIGPNLDQHRALVDYESFAGQLAPSNVDTFDWSQTYGPINWPRRGRTVMDVASRSASYWKAENLDVFDGRQWTTGTVGSGVPALLDVDASARARWTRTIQVTIRTMKIATILAAGAAAEPEHVPSPVFQGTSPGTWVATNPLAPGDSYSVDVYDPHPRPGQLARAGDTYPRPLDVYRVVELPSSNGYGPPTKVELPAFHSGGAVLAGPFLNDQTGAVVMTQSPYAGMYALAQRLADASSTPYAYAQGVLRYLSRGYTYNEAPPRSSYPLVTFLFRSKIGYCQQFAGSMALLLRLGGVPARVAVGFTPGTFDDAQHQWEVTDVDAHAWVEAWFPHYGWVRFDPTPAAAPARGGRVAITSTSALGAATPLPPRINLPSQANSATAKHGSRGSGGPSALLLIGLVSAGLAAIALLCAALRAGRERGIDQLVAELERAMARTGRPMAAGMTLAGLERRVRGRPEAEEYIRAIRLSRFGSAGAKPTLRQRRALRAELRSGLGLGGALRALWALPPRWHAPHRLSGARRGA